MCDVDQDALLPNLVAESAPNVQNDSIHSVVHVCERGVFVFHRYQNFHHLEIAASTWSIRR